MYTNTISGTATEKGGNDNIITVLSLPPFSVALPEIVLLYM
jgi:hypothetical protein